MQVVQMSNPSKEKGTKAETRVVRFMAEYGIRAERCALSGAEDCGAIKFEFNGNRAIIEVKTGKMTDNPSRKKLAGWIAEATREGNNAQLPSVLVVARYNRSPKDYDVWVESGMPGMMIHWYLDDWCAEIVKKYDL